MASSSKSTRSTATLHVPIDITIEILSRLPVKSLLRFQSVCKTWYALIRSPSFISKHKKTHSTLSFTSLLVTTYVWEFSIYDMSLHYNDSFGVPVNVCFPFLVGRDSLSVVGVCDGLVCLSLSPNRYDSLILCNPTTRQFREIPDCEWRENDSLLLEYGWYEEMKQVSFGFGFDPSANDYKLIRILYFECPNGWVVRAAVYAMSTGTWRDIERSKLSVFNGEVDDALLINESSSNFAGLNGVLYWAARDFFCEGFVLSFDLGDEVFRRIRAQCLDVVRYESNWRVMEMKDKVALVVFHPDDGCYDVWVLNENEMSWTNEFKVGSFPGIESPVGCGENGEITVVGCGKNGELVVTDHNKSGNIKLFLYDPKSQEAKNLCFGRVPYQSCICLYTETLLPVKENIENHV